MTDERPSLYVLKATDIATRAQTFSHPWNPRSELTGYQMARAAGLRHIGVNFARMAPGKESFVYHAHWCEEEWIYILSGRGMVRVDSVETEVGAGDFVAFPLGIAHQLRNPFEQELTYLMGGESKDTDIADFPELGKRMFKYARGVDIVDLADVKPFGPLDDARS